MPWQRLVADVGGEMIRDEDSGMWLPAYDEVVFTVPRQSGKTIEIFVWEVDRSLLWEAFDGAPQAIAYTAQSGSDARKKFRKDQVPLLKRSPFWAGVSSVRYAAEDMGAEFANGSTISVWNNSEEAGHGSTIDLGIMDEVFADEDDRREQALLPAMATRHDHQKLVTSTAGTEKSVVLNRKQAAGRAAVEAGRREGTAYFEWSADPDDDPERPETWWKCMPALGFTITERTVQSALNQMREEDGDLAEFKRAWLNIPIRSAGDQVIPRELWADAVSEDALVKGTRVFGVSASMNRDRASIAVADHDGNLTMVDERENVGWLEDRCVELANKWNAPIAVDVGDPAGHLVDRLTERGVNVKRYTAQTYAHACGAFFDRLADSRIKAFPDKGLDAAIEGATKRTLGDAWAWARKSSAVDISPLVAATLAVDAASAAEPPAPRLVNLSEV